MQGVPEGCLSGVFFLLMGVGWGAEGQGRGLDCVIDLVRHIFQGVEASDPGTFSGARRPCKANWKREFKLPWREAGPPNHHDDKMVSDQ